MKIAIVELYCGESGTIGFYNSQEIGIAKAYSRWGHDVIIAYPHKRINKTEVQIINEKVKILWVPCIALGVHSFYKLDFLKDYNIELVHLDADNQIYAPHVIHYCDRNHILVYNYVGALYSDASSKIKRSFMNKIASRNLQCFKMHATFVKTNYVKRQLEKQGVKNVTVAPVGLDTSVIPSLYGSKADIRKQLDLSLNKKILIFVGRLEEYKRPFEAVKLLKALDESYELILIGTGTLQSQLQLFIKQQNLDRRIHYIEKVKNTEIHKYYKAADCFLNFNEKEIFGMSILEAMYQGCPVIARHAPGPDMIVEDKVTGYLCDSDSDMLEMLSCLNSDMGIASKNRIMQEFSWNNTVKIILNELGNMV